MATTATATPTGIHCPHATCTAPIPTLTLTAQLASQIRQHTSRYYANWLVCDDPACGNRTRTMRVYGHRCLGPRGLGTGCTGRMVPEYGEKALYEQLLYLQALFDVERAKKNAGKSNAKNNNNNRNNYGGSNDGKSAGVPVKKEPGAHAPDVEAETQEKVSVLAELNRQRFDAVKAVATGYLEKSGRLWVAMDGLFGFAIRARAVKEAREESVRRGRGRAVGLDC